MTTIAEAATELRRLKDLEKEQDAALKETKKQIDRLEKQTIPEILDAMGADNARIPGVGTVYLQDRMFANVRAENRERFYEWLRANGHGDLVKDYVHPGTLNSFAKEQLEKEGLLPDFIEAAYTTQATLRKA